MSIQIDEGELEYWQMPTSTILWIEEQQKEREKLWVKQKEAGSLKEIARKEARKFRPEIAKRDGDICATCGSTAKLTVDHKTPLSRGGTNDLDNLQILCRSCNSRKAAK